MVRFLAVMWLLIMTAPPLAAAETAAEKEVIATVQKLFDAMSAHDPEAAQAVLLPEGRMASVRDAGEVRFNIQEQFAARLGTMSQPIFERMWNPKVLIQGRIAHLWAEYDFWQSGKFGHCGIDSVSLLKTDAGWKIAGLAYTMETTGCKPSPLGPPPAPKQ